jgi:hypothetical membrane protein
MNLRRIAMLGPPLFLAITVVAGLLKPGYDIAQQSVSDLAVGQYGWIQTANFVLLGVAVAAYALTRRSLLFAVAGAGLVASAAFEGDLAGAAVTSHGTVHNMLFLVIFLALIVGYARQGKRLLAAAIFALVVLFAMFAGDVGDPLHGVSGLLERVMIAVAFAPIALSAAQELYAVAPWIGRVEAADAR